MLHRSESHESAVDTLHCMHSNSISQLGSDSSDEEQRAVSVILTKRRQEKGQAQLPWKIQKRNSPEHQALGHCNVSGAGCGALGTDEDVLALHQGEESGDAILPVQGAEGAQFRHSESSSRCLDQGGFESEATHADVTSAEVALQSLIDDCDWTLDSQPENAGGMSPSGASTSSDSSPSSSSSSSSSSSVRHQGKFSDARPLDDVAVAAAREFEAEMLVTPAGPPARAQARVFSTRQSCKVPQMSEEVCSIWRASGDNFSGGGGGPGVWRAKGSGGPWAGVGVGSYKGMSTFG